MSALRARLGAAARHLPGIARLAVSLRRRRARRRITQSGIFDREWYERQAGRRFDSEAAALKHYLRSGRVAGLAPSPLFEPAWYDRRRWRSRELDPLLVYLSRSQHLRTRAPHILFEPGRHLHLSPEAVRHPGGPLGHFLTTVRPDTLLQVDHVLDRQVDVTWSQARQALQAALDGWREQEKLRQAPRRTAHFDHDASRRFLAGVAGLQPRRQTDGAPLISVVMPVWNRARSVRRAVESVQAQTLGDWELIVVDDGSTDDTPAVLAGLAHFEPRLRVLRQERAGVSAARNLAIAQARGRYVAFLDSDNTWEPDFLRVMAAVMQRDDLPVAYSAMQLRQGAAVSYRGFDGGRAHLLVGNHIDLNVLVVREDVLRRVGGFSTDLRRTVDYDLVLTLSAVVPLTYLPFIGAVYTEDDGDGSRISVRESISWDYVVRARHSIDWTAAAARPRVPGRLSVVMPVAEDVRLARRCLVHLLSDADAGGLDIEIVLVGNGCSRWATLTLASLCLVDPRVRLVRQPVDLRRALAVDVGLTEVSGEDVVVCETSVVIGDGVLAAVREELADPAVAAVQPAVTGPDGTVLGAGATFTARAGLPIPLLAGHPLEDVRALGPSVDIPALLGPLWAARTDDLVRAHGLDCVYLSSWHETDLSLRLARAGIGVIRLLTGLAVQKLPEGQAGQSGPSGQGGQSAPGSQGGPSGPGGQGGPSGPGGQSSPGSQGSQSAPGNPRGQSGQGGQVSRSAADAAEAHDDELFHERWGETVQQSGRTLWERAGFVVAHHQTGGGRSGGRSRRLRPVVVRPPRTVPDGPAAGLPALRWAIKIASPAGPSGHSWGDWHFAQALAAALRRLGQDVVVDAREAHARPTNHLDDVNLVLRGLDAVVPDEAKVQLMWVISHPDLVTPDEMRGYDRVLAASVLWSRRTRQRFGIAVEPLLQCTDAATFRPEAAEPDSGAPVLFVGNSRGLYRHVVRYALEAGADLHVYGKGWEPFLPDGVVRGTQVPGSELPAAYAAAGVVLNDHWDDMRVEGFISNRVFDVTAVGGRLTSDAVEGLADVFGSDVPVWQAQEELAALLRADPDDVFPDRAARLALAERVRREHSFDARARRLLDVALECRKD